MKPAPRPVRPPTRMLALAAGVVAISGGTLVSIPDSRLPEGLSPRTVAHLLAGAVPDGAREIRVNGVYGSGHKGTWQVVASFSWRGRDGSLHGGTTELPQHGGQPPLATPLSPEQLQVEHRIGWSLQRLGRATRRIDLGTATLGMVELAITADEGATLLACSAIGTDVEAACAEYESDGDIARRFADRLIDVPGLDAVSVQRASTPVTPVTPVT